jgi:hypothetical protein
MRNLWVVVLVALLLAMAGAAHADAATDALKATVESLQKQLTDALNRLKALEAAQTAAKPAVEPAERKPQWYDKVKLTGYWQARYEDRKNAVGNFPPGTWPPTPTEATDEFLIRRMYFGAIATPNDRTTAVLLFRHLSFAAGVDIEAMYVDYKLADQWNVEFGRVYNKFGWDAWESSSKRLPFDRFAGLEGYRNGGVRGLYFQGPSDHGLYLTHKPGASSSIWEPTVHVGVLNGNFLGAENNTGETYEVDLRWNDRKGWQWGTGFLSGDFTENVGTPAVATTTDRRMFGLYLHRDPKPWGVQAEWIDGELFGYDVRGWYGQFAYAVKDATPYCRYERYEPTEGVPGDTWEAVRLGCAWQLDKNNEVTFEYMWGERGDVDTGQWGVQWQTGL